MNDPFRDADRALEELRDSLPADAELQGRAREVASRAAQCLNQGPVASRLRWTAAATAAAVLATVGALVLWWGAPPPVAVVRRDPVPVPAPTRGAPVLSDELLRPAAELVALPALAEYRFDRSQLVALDRLAPLSTLAVVIADVQGTLEVPDGAIVFFAGRLEGVSLRIGSRAAVHCLGPVSGNIVVGDGSLLLLAGGVAGGIESGQRARLVIDHRLGGSCRLGAGSHLLCRADVAGPIDVPVDGVVAITGSFRSQATVAAGGTLIVGGEGRGGLAMHAGARAFVCGGWRGGVYGPGSSDGVVLGEAARRALERAAAFERP